MWTCNGLDLQTLGSQLFMPKNLPNHWISHTPTGSSLPNPLNYFDGANLEPPTVRATWLLDGIGRCCHHWLAIGSQEDRHFKFWNWIYTRSKEKVFFHFMRLRRPSQFCQLRNPSQILSKRGGHTPISSTVWGVCDLGFLFYFLSYSFVVTQPLPHARWWWWWWLMCCACYLLLWLVFAWRIFLFLVCISQD